MAHPLVILGSARDDGETRRAVDIAFPQAGMNLKVLPDFALGGYHYDHLNAEDGFGAIADAMMAADKLVLATPVYWYAMSAPMKVFFDRLTDLTENRKDQGKTLSGKSVWLIATGTEDVLPDGFEVPFARTAEYFAMRWRGSAYLYTGSDCARRLTGETALRRFSEEILAA